MENSMPTTAHRFSHTLPPTSRVGLNDRPVFYIYHKLFNCGIIKVYSVGLKPTHRSFATKHSFQSIKLSKSGATLVFSQKHTYDLLK